RRRQGRRRLGFTGRVRRRGRRRRLRRRAVGLGQIGRGEVGGEAAGRVDRLLQLLGNRDGGDLLELLLGLVELGVAHHLLDAGLELARDGPCLARPLAGGAQGARQVLG